MINKLIPFLSVIILSLSVTPALTQSDPANGYSVQHFTDENGLPQNSINDLLFDKDGYLWLASQVGLVRFNGYSFKLYYPDDKPVMESNIVYLGKNSSGRLYFQADDHNLYYYQGNNSTSASPVNTAALKSPFLLNGRKQLFDFSHFLNDTTPGGDALRRKRIFLDLFDHNKNFYVVDPTHLYLTSGDSLYYYNGRDLQALSLLPQRRLAYLLHGQRIYVIDKNTLMAVYDGGKKVGGPEPIKGDLSSAAESLTNDQIHLYSCGQYNHLLAGQRLYRVMVDETGMLRTVFLVDLSFITNISAVEYNDALDLLIVATNTEGFYFLRKGRFNNCTWPAPLQQAISQHRFGPMVLHGDKEIITDKFIFGPDGHFRSLHAGAVWQRCLFVDRGDRVWAARYDHPKLLTSAMDSIKGYPALDGIIVDYTEDKEGHLYCLTQQSLYRLEGDSFHRVFVTGSLHQIGQNEALCFLDAHRLWIANSDGLIEYDPSTGQAHDMPELAGAHVRAVHVCRNGAVLVGTYGQGYFYWRNNRFFRLPMDKNGYLITAHCFLEDKNDNIWIPCNKGLFRIPRADMDAYVQGATDLLYYYYYGRQDGLLTNEFNGGYNPSGVITPSGFVSLLSMRGMVCFYADSLAAAFPRGPIDLTHVESEGRPLPITDTISLSARYDNLMLEISSPYLGDRSNLYLQYNVQGLNDTWKEIPEDGIINLNRLSPGDYTLKIRRVNGFGINNYQYREWHILVPPLFYQTKGFIVLACFIFLLLVVLLVQLRLKLIEKQKEVRIKAEKLKGAVVRLEETVQKLQESESALLKASKQREKLISLVIHDLRSPLRFLTMLSGDLHDNQAQFTAGEMKERTYWVKKGAQDIYHFSEDFLLWVTSQKDNFRISRQLFKVRPLLQEIYDFYSEQVQQRGNQLTYAAEESLEAWSDPHILITIIRNLTDNANKYTHQGTIHIEAKAVGKDLVITVTDTGKGMSLQQVAAFMGEDTLDNVKSGSQLGHKFIFDLTQRIDGTLSIDSKEKIGTTITLRLPLRAPSEEEETL